MNPAPKNHSGKSAASVDEEAAALEAQVAELQGRVAYKKQIAAIDKQQALNASYHEHKEYTDAHEDTQQPLANIETLLNEFHKETDEERARYRLVRVENGRGGYRPLDPSEHSEDRLTISYPEHLDFLQTLEEKVNLIVIESVNLGDSLRDIVSEKHTKIDTLTQQMASLRTTVDVFDSRKRRRRERARERPCCRCVGSGSGRVCLAAKGCACAVGGRMCNFGCVCYKAGLVCDVMCKAQESESLGDSDTVAVDDVSVHSSWSQCSSAYDGHALDEE